MVAKRKYFLEDAKTIAIERDGECLSDSWNIPGQKLLWKCNKCHNQWSTKFYHIKQGHWCPLCSLKKPQRKLYTKTCIICGIVFNTTKNNTSDTCSRLCHRRLPKVKKEYEDRVKVFQKDNGAMPYRRYGSLKSSSKSRGLSLTISLQEYENLVAKPCHYCGKTLEKERGCSLDRILNDKGYELDNILPCCGACNQIRNVHLTSEEMKVAMDAVILFRKSKDFILPIV